MEYTEMGILKTFNSPKAIKDKGIIEGRNLSDLYCCPSAGN